MLRRAMPMPEVLGKDIPIAAPQLAKTWRRRKVSPCLIVHACRSLSERRVGRAPDITHPRGPLTATLLNING